MSGTITLDEAKHHLMVTDQRDDTLIASYLEAADRHIKKRVRCPALATGHAAPAAIKAAALILVADLYDCRASLSTASKIVECAAVARLLFPYTDSGVSHECRKA